MRTTVRCSRRTLAVLGGASFLSLAACQSRNASPRASASSPARLRVVASTTQIADYVTQLASGGDDLAFTRTGADGAIQELGARPSQATLHLELTCLLAANASAHEHEMTVPQSQALAQADLFLVSGVDLEHFLDDAVLATGFKGTMVVTSGVLGAADVDDLAAQKEKEAELAYAVDRGQAAVEVSPWPFGAEDAGSEPEFRYDPHVWTSPRGAAVQVANIGKALERAAGAGAGVRTLRDHVEAYTRRLERLDQWVRDSLATVEASKRVLFTSHDAFGYFARDYGVRFEGAALSDFNAQQDATAHKIQQTVDAIRSSGAVAIFAETSNNPRSVSRIAELAGVRAVIGDEALYGDSLGEPGSDGETYIGSILHNVTNMTTAWGGTAAELPQELRPWAPQDVLEP